MPRKPKTPEYQAFISMKKRCRNPEYRDYPRWGGRGIEVRFNSFDEFLKEVGPRPSSRHSMDRKDNNGHYEPGNVRWATVRDQANNRRANRNMEAFGATLTLAEVARATGIRSRTIQSRIDDLGWSISDAVSTPIFAKRGCANR